MKGVIVGGMKIQVGDYWWVTVAGMNNDLCLTSAAVFGWCGVGEVGVRGVSLARP